MFTARMRCASVHRPDQLRARSSPSSGCGLTHLQSGSRRHRGSRSHRTPGRRAELAADALDVAVDRAVVDIDVVLVGDVEQLVAALDHAGPLGERLEDQEFGHRQRDVLAVPHDLVPRRVHRQPAALEQRRFGLVAGRAGFALGAGPGGAGWRGCGRSAAAARRAWRYSRRRPSPGRALRPARRPSRSGKSPASTLDLAHPAEQLHPVHRGILMSNTPRSGGFSANAFSAVSPSE